MTQWSVDEYVDQSQSILNSTGALDELSTRTKLIDPFIRLLGWDLYSSEVKLEYSVDMMASNKQVDYALVLDEDPEILIEAKRSDSDITQHNIGQLSDYMQTEWVELGLITNGKQFIALHLKPGEGGPPEIIELGTIHLDDLNENHWLINLFSRNSIEEGRAQKIISNMVQREQAIEHLQNNRDAISEEIMDVVTRDLDEAIHEEATGLAGEFIDSLIETIDRSDPNPRSKTKGRKPDPKRKENLTRPSDKADQIISRQELEGQPDDSVVVVPAKIERGLDFLFRNEAWGFIHIGQNPDYIAFYITGGEGVSAVWYVAQVSDVVDIKDADLVDDPAELVDLDDPNERRKKVVELQPDSLYELEDPIPYAKKYPQSLRYTTLSKLQNAETTEDLF